MIIAAVGSGVLKRHTLDHSVALRRRSSVSPVHLTCDLASIEHAEPDCDLTFVRRVLEAARSDGAQNFTAIFRDAVRDVELHSVQASGMRALTIAALRSTEDEWRRAYFRHPPPLRQPPSSHGLPSLTHDEAKRVLREPPKPRRCLNCKRMFAPRRAGNEICSPECSRARERGLARRRSEAQMPVAHA